MASDDGTCCVAAVAGDGLAGDASLSGDHPSNDNGDNSGRDVVQGCRVDREEDVGEEDVGEEDDREEDVGEEDDRQDDSREKDDGKEDHREEVDREEAGCRVEPVIEGWAAQRTR